MRNGPDIMRNNHDDEGFWLYELADGWKILAGRTASDNDRLTFRVAGANDFWFHVRGICPAVT